MVEVVNRARNREQLQSVRSAQKKVNVRINKILEQLKRLESEPGTPPWVSFRRVDTVKELQSKGPPLRQALKQDLILLKSHLRDLDRKSAGIKSGAAYQSAQQSSRDYKKQLDEALREAEKNGQLPEDELAQLRTGAEKVVQRFVGMLNASPTGKNMDRVLEELEIPLILGSDIERGVCGDAMTAVAHAAEKIVEQKDNAFRNNPTADNLDKLLQSKETAQQTGGKTPDKPKGWKPANTTHPVVLGDTLSAIAEHYYGNKSFWDVIYYENYDLIRDDVRNLRIGIILKIP
jgi:hypothetical protein